MIDYDRYKMIRADYRGDVLTLTLNRPDAFNAVNHQLHEELGDIFYDVAKDERAAVVVLTGEGKAFCGGGDLGEAKAHYDASAPGAFLSRVTAKRIIFSLLDLEKPIIARVNGPAMGLGATLALFCDLIYMSSTAKIADPHVSAGVVAGDGGAVIWPQLVGYARAKEFLMTGDAITAEQAERMGLINHCVAPSALDDEVYGMAQRLADGPQNAIRWSKTSVNIGLKQLAHSMMDASIAYEFLTMTEPDSPEAVSAFVEKRDPDFSKKPLYG